MYKYLKRSIRRKIARRYTREYPATINNYELKKDGTIQFAQWENPLAPPSSINQEMVAFFRQFIKKGDLAIDIGANIGDTTVPMGLAAGEDGLTLGFDPNPFVFKILEINSSLNKQKTNIVPLRYAITVEEDEFYFISSEASFANGGISKTKDSRHGKFVFPGKVRGVNLMGYLTENYESWLSRLSFIKVDAEGYDKEIIKSISELVKKYKPVLVAESFGKSSDVEKYELYDVIRSLGYRIWYFADFDINAEVSELKSRNDILTYKETVNLYAVPE